MINKFFSGDLKIQIMKYCKKLESISQEYDVLIFMARKSICFYDALVLNNEIQKTDAEIVITTSSRILSYDCEFLRNKKIALLDDIVIKGTTLYDTINFLLEKDINNFDVYYIASQRFENNKTNLISKYLKEPILELNNHEILVLGNAITSYISASACSYNIDYPVFYTDSIDGFLENYIEKNNCTAIPSCIAEDNTNIYVQNFDCQKYFEQFELYELNKLQHKSNEIILKFRIFYRKDATKRKVVIIPIIVLPELCQSEIETIFNTMASLDLYYMVKNSDINKETSNMLSVIQYMLSYQLFISVFHNKTQFGFQYSINNQNYIFPKSYSNKVLNCLNKCDLIPYTKIKDILVIDDFFKLSEIYRYFFDFIGSQHQKDDGHKVKFSFKDVLEYCSRFYLGNKYELIGNVSILFDYAIDTGLIVPEISMQSDKYIRAYRLSEQYELQEIEFDLIIHMYNEYQKKSQKDEMGKILTEKLLVLFFREVIMKILTEYKSNTAEEKSKNLFGITYARFGPVVSDNSTELGVSKDSYLTNRLFDESRSPYKRLYNRTKLNRSLTGQSKEEKRVYVKQSDETFNNLPENWKRETRLFVNRYTDLEKILNFYNVFEKSNYIKSFDKFLIISAIGSSKDNQLLSIAAELKIYQNAITLKEQPHDIIFAIDSVMDGIISGIWKYICYKTEEYKNCYAITAKSMYLKTSTLKEYTNEIDIIREYIDKLQKIRNSPLENLKHDVQIFLDIYKSYNNFNSNNKDYIDYVNKFNTAYNVNQNQCKTLLDKYATNLVINMYEKTDKLCRKRENVDSAYIDTDKLENLFTEPNNATNINFELMNTIEKLMDEAAIILYKILVYWNCIIEYMKTNINNIKLINTDKNANYLKQAKELISKRSEQKDKINNLDQITFKYDEIILRFRELEYEIDLLMFCINQYILKNNSKFLSLQKFFIVKRDDGNAIELDEIIATKEREQSLNKYFGFEDDNSYAAFVKSKQSLQIIQKLNNFSGYTLLDYDCVRGCNAIIKVGEQYYSKRIKDIVRKVLDKYSNKIIEIRDRS